MKSFLSLAAVAVLAISAQAGELDSPNPPNVGATDSTIVVRVNTETGAVEKLELSKTLATDEAEALAKDASASFEVVPTAKIKSELDQETGASSWFWWCPTYYGYGYGYSNYYYNTGYYNYGNWYTPYYNYNYGYYNYYYYRPYYGRWWW